MVLDCALLVTLVLVQLPKKEAGAGVAFGAAATDALFGAGSGNMLTKITKYVAGIFFGLAILMAIIAGGKPQSGASALQQKLTQGTVAPLAPPAPSETAPASAPSGGGFLQLSNAVPAASSNAAPAEAPAPVPTVKTNK
jgi:preprotein translocase subunit SecG